MLQTGKIVSNKCFKITVFYVFIFVCCFAVGLYNSTIDVDLFSRLIQGWHVFNYHSVFKEDIISYTPTHIWYDHEWLSSFLIFVVLKYFGAYGILFFKTILAFLSVIFIDLVVVLKEKKFDYDYKYLYILLYLALGIEMLLIHKLRCQQFTYIFYPLFILLLENSRCNPKSKLIYLIPPLMLLWLNCHGASMYGIGVLGLYIIGEVLSKKPFKHLVLLLISCILVYFINPWGIDFVKFMINAIGVDRAFIAEWQSPFTFPVRLIASYLFYLISITFVYVYGQVKSKVNFKTFDYTKFLILLATLILALKYIKHNFTFFITVFMFLHTEFKIFFDDIKKLFKKTFPINYIVIPVSVVLIIYSFINFPVDNYYQNATATFPSKPMQFIKDNDIKGRLFAPYYLSGFIAYKNYPDIKIFMDGRLEQVYDEKTVKEHLRFLTSDTRAIDNVYEKYHPDIILLETYWRAYSNLKNSDKYRLIYDDGLFAIFADSKKVKPNYDFTFKTKYYNKKQFLKSDYFN